MRSMGVRVLCQKGFDKEKDVQVHEKGLKTLIRISDERELQELSRYLSRYLYCFHYSFLFVIYFIKAV